MYTFNNFLNDLFIKSINNYIYDIKKKYKKPDIIKIFGYIYIIKLAISILYSSKSYAKYYIKKIPFIQNKINTEQNKIIDELKLKFNNEIKDIQKFNKIPDTGCNDSFIIDIFIKMKQKSKTNYSNISGATYSNNDKLDGLLSVLFSYFNKSNPLYTNLFPYVRKMENELILFMKNLFNGDKDVCGSFTSGGTESILLACKSYRELGKSKNIEYPEIIASTTVHCAFNKACQYFNIKLVLIDCLENGLFDLKKLKSKINKNTILIVASSPSFNLGICDQIKEINDIAIKYNKPLHVDACIGAFLVNFSNEIMDFRLKGVTSISADFHKYGSSPKGASSILYKNKDIMKYQYYIDSTWSGGIYASPTISGSRCGNIVALTWATTMYLGLDGYEQNYYNIIKLKNIIVYEINNIPELYVYGNPISSIVAIGSKQININILSDELKKKNWGINVIQNPSGFHFCITNNHNENIINSFITDLKLLVLEIKQKPSIKYSPCIYGTMQKINDNEIIDDVLVNYLHIVNGNI